MAILQKPPVSARAKVARCALACLALSLLSTALARGESLGVGSYYSWQWSGFSRTQLVPTANSYPTSLLAAVMLRSWTSDSIVSESTVESSSTIPVVNPAALAGVIYFDENQNGVRDSGDWAIRDAIVSLTSASTSTVVIAVTDKDGAYSFQNLTADDYTITLLTPSSVPGQINVGTLKDANGVDIFTGLGVAVGQSSIANIQLKEGYTGITYDFGQYVYPTDLLSKRMLLNNDPGVPHTPDAPTPPTPPVPEPGTLALLLVAGLAVSGFTRRRR
jgi:hypothetical protein